MRRLRFVSLFLAVFSTSALALSGQQFVYVTNENVPIVNQSGVTGYSIDTTTGALTPIPGSPFGAGFHPQDVVVDPAGKFAYVTNAFGDTQFANSISAFTINSLTGVLTPIGSFDSGGIQPHGMAIDSTGRFLYVANPFGGVGAIGAFVINSTTGALTPVSGSPFATNEPGILAVAPTGRFLYADNSVFSTVSGFAINANSGGLSAVPGSPFAAGIDFCSHTGMAVDPTSRFLYVVNLPTILGGSNDISAYAINATTGALTPVPGSPFSFANQMPCALAIEPTGRFVYLTSLSPSPGSVSAYAINSDGSLALVAGSNIATGLFPSGIAVDLTGAFLYVTNAHSDNVSAYVINSTTGSLAAVPGSPFPAGSVPSSVTTSPRPQGIRVTIDIKPGDDPPSINVRSMGKIPVAILSSPTFNAPASVKPSSLTFGASGYEVSLAFCSGAEDVNGDGRLDLVCHFTTQLTGFQAGDKEGNLRGTTVSQVPIQGSDVIVTER